MRRLNALWWALLAATPACARGCGGTTVLPPLEPTATQDATVRVLHPADAVEKALMVRLVERRSPRQLLPGWSMLPWRRLHELRPDQHLILRVSAAGLGILERTLDAQASLDPQRVTELLRWAVGQWQSRAGVAANRLILAVDADATDETLALVRHAALTAGQWQVVAVARDQEYLVELMLNPPPQRRPDPAAPATAASLPGAASASGSAH